MTSAQRQLVRQIRDMDARARTLVGRCAVCLDPLPEVSTRRRKYCSHRCRSSKREGPLAGAPFYGVAATERSPAPSSLAAGMFDAPPGSAGSEFSEPTVDREDP